MDATTILRQIEEDEQQREAARKKHASELALLQSDISAAKKREREAKESANEIDELRTRARKAFTAEHRRLCSVAKSEHERAKQLQDRYDTLAKQYAAEDSKQSRTIEDVIGEVAEERVLQLLKELQDKEAE